MIATRGRKNKRCLRNLRKESEKMWRVKAIIRVLGVVTPKMGKWLKQIPGMTSLPRKVQSYEHQRYCAGPSSLTDKDHLQGEWGILYIYI